MQLAVYDDHPLYTGNLEVNFANITKLGILFLPTPEQTASNIDTLSIDSRDDNSTRNVIRLWCREIGYLIVSRLWRRNKIVLISAFNLMSEDRSLLKVGTPDPSRLVDFLGHQLLVNRHDPWQSNLVETECNGQDGGKIVEKAKASSNFLDTRWDRNPWVNPWTPKGGLNSILLLMTYFHRGMCTKVCYTRDRYVRRFIMNFEDVKSFLVDKESKGIGLSDFERIGEWSMPIQAVLGEFILTKDICRPKPAKERSYVSYRVNSALEPKGWNTRDHLVILLWSIWRGISTTWDSLRQVGQDIAPKAGTTGHDRHPIVNSGVHKNSGFPKGCKPYLSLKWGRMKNAGNGVSVVIYDEGGQLIKSCEKSSGRNYTTASTDKKTPSGKRLTISPTYEEMFDMNIWKSAYHKIKSNPGNMTPGTDDMTLDGTSKKWIEETIRKLKDRSFQFKPSRRKVIPPKGGTRPLGIPSPRDKIVQEVMKMILESVYEPLFKETSHGFRPKRSTATAIFETRKWNGIKWIIEGDIRKYFDNVDHHILAELIKDKIKDKNLIDLYWKLVKAGYVNNGKYEESNLGVPQGGILSPLLSNIYLHEFDEFMEDIIKKYSNDRRVSKANPEYLKLKRKISKLDKLKLKEMDEITWRTLKNLRKQLEKLPSAIRTEETGTRIYYNRYADDWIIGVTGTKALAGTIREEVNAFLKNKLKIELNEEKTKITHIVEDKTQYLGFHISGRHRKYTASQITRGNARQKQKRAVNSQIIIEAPIKKLLEGLEKKGFKWEGKDWSKGKTAWIYMRPEDIIQRYNWIIDGILNYYRPVENRNQLGRIVWTLQASAAYTLARKLRLDPKKIWKKFGNPITIKVQGKKGIEKRVTLRKPQTLERDLTFHLGTYHGFDPLSVASFSVRSNHVWDQPCILCGSEVDIEIHNVKHIRVGQTKGFTQIMRNMNRKQIPVCGECHHKIHMGRYDGMSLKKIKEQNTS